MTWYEILIIVIASLIIVSPLFVALYKKKKHQIMCNSCSSKKCDICKFNKEELMAKYNGYYVYALLIKGFSIDKCSIVKDLLLKKNLPHIEINFHDEKDSVVIISKDEIDMKTLQDELKHLKIETKQL